MLILEREDNCHTLPGKADTVGKGKNKVQKKVLTDYIKNLYVKFTSENLGVRISMATFYRARPRHLALANFVSRLSCLCQRHQNMALKLKSLKSLNITSTTNPDQFIQSTTIEQIGSSMQALSGNDVKYDQWKRVKLDDGKLKTKLVQETKTSEEFKEMFLKDVQDFKEHTQRVSNQFHEVKRLKENLPNGLIIMQMDFAENYTCRSFEEVQIAYWNSNMVTLHPVVIYVKAYGELQHYSYVIISDNLNHNASSVRAFLNKLIPEVKTLLDVKMVHYLTDSPTSQLQ